MSLKQKALVLALIIYIFSFLGILLKNGIGFFICPEMGIWVIMAVGMIDPIKLVIVVTLIKFLIIYGLSYLIVRSMNKKA